MQGMRESRPEYEAFRIVVNIAFVCVMGDILCLEQNFRLP